MPPVLIRSNSLEWHNADEAFLPYKHRACNHLTLVLEGHACRLECQSQKSQVALPHLSTFFKGSN
ncbi:hypothetical protein ASD02_23640 [Ensifer sp. Root1252]|nr:hypothetical protein ASD02_23640 [Ensifer sp. Root1252]KRC78026.1 hypothetical protein ASE32_28250 [Ensifer sp. Root231]